MSDDIRINWCSKHGHLSAGEVEFHKMGGCTIRRPRLVFDGE